MMNGLIKFLTNKFNK